MPESEKPPVTLPDSTPDLAIYLNTLTNDECTQFCEKQRAYLQEIIYSPIRFFVLMDILKENKKPAVYEALKEHLKTLLRNKNDFNNILTFLAPAQRSDFLDSLKEETLSMLEQDLHILLKNLKQLQECILEHPKERLKKPLSDEEKHWLIFYACIDKNDQILAYRNKHGKALKEILFRYAKKNKDNPRLTQAFIISTLKSYCHRVESIKKKNGKYTDFFIFPSSRSRSRDINLALANHLIQSLEAGESLANVFSEEALQKKRESLKKEMFPTRQNPFERKSVWSAALNQIFHFASTLSSPSRRQPKTRYRKSISK